MFREDNIYIGDFKDDRLDGDDCYEICGLRRQKITIRKGKFRRGQFEQPDLSGHKTGAYEITYNRINFFERLYGRKAKKTLDIPGWVNIEEIREYNMHLCFGADSKDRQKENDKTGKLSRIKTKRGNYGALYEGTFKHNYLHGVNCRKLDSNGEIEVGTYIYGQLDTTRPLYRINRSCSWGIEMWYNTSTRLDRFTNVKSAELYNWLSEKTTIDDVPDVVKRFLREHLQSTMYGKEYKSLGIPKTGQASVKINGRLYTGSFNNYLLDGQGTVLSGCSDTEDGIYSLGFLVNGVGIEKWPSGNYSVCISIFDKFSSTCRADAHNSAKYEDVMKDLDLTEEGLKAITGTTVSTNELQIIARAKEILKGLESKKTNKN
jgi:hypothetical protein